MTALLSLSGLIGAPLMGGWIGWRVYSGAPWRLAGANRLERGAIAMSLASSVFIGWVNIFHGILEAMKP